MRKKDIDSIAWLIRRARERGEPKPIVFIGAGASISAGIPGAGSILEYIQSHYNGKPEISKPIVVPPTYYSLMGELNMEERHELLRSFITSDNVKINLTHIYLAQMLKEEYVDYVLTVNFDDLLLRACALFNFLPPTYDISILNKFTTKALMPKSVTFLHGQHNGFWLLNTKEELEIVKTSVSKVINRICADRTWIVVGYSGDDPIFEQIADIGDFTKDLFWVGYKDHEPSEKVQNRLLDRQNSNAYWVSGYDSDSFFLKLHSELKMKTPDIFSNPFTFLQRQINTIKDIDVYKDRPFEELFIDVQQRYEIVKKQTNSAIKLYEHQDLTGLLTLEDMTRDELKKQIIESIVKGIFDNADNLAHHIRSTDEELKNMLAQLYNNWGLDFLEKGKRIQNKELILTSIEKFKKAVALNPQKSSANINWGLSLSALARLEKKVKFFHDAIEKFELASRMNEHKCLAYNSWGNTLSYLGIYEKNKTFIESAIEKYKLASMMEPDRRSIYSNWSNSLMSLSELVDQDQSLSILLEAIEIAKTSVKLGSSPYNLSCCYSLIKDKYNALKFLEKSLATKSISATHVQNDQDWHYYFTDEDFVSLLNQYK